MVKYFLENKKLCPESLPVFFISFLVPKASSSKKTFQYQKEGEFSWCLVGALSRMEKGLPTQNGNDTWTIQFHEPFMNFSNICYTGTLILLNNFNFSFIHDCERGLIFISVGHRLSHSSELRVNRYWASAICRISVVCYQMTHRWVLH